MPSVLLFGYTSSVGEYLPFLLRDSYFVTIVTRQKINFENKSFYKSVRSIVSELKTPADYEKIFEDFTHDIIISCIGSRSANKKDVNRIDAGVNISIINACLKMDNKTKLFILLSGSCVRKPEIPLQFAKLRSENALRESGLPYFIPRVQCLYKCFDKKILGAYNTGKLKTFTNENISNFFPCHSKDVALYISNVVNDYNNEKYMNKIISIGGEVSYNSYTISLAIKNAIEYNNSEYNIKVKSIGVKQLKSIVKVCKNFPCADNIVSLMELIVYYNKHEMYIDEHIKTTPFSKYVEDFLYHTNDEDKFEKLIQT